MSDRLKKAIEYAELKHSGQVGRDGLAYIEHPKEVASRVDGEDAKIVAWLHDTVEDTDATVDEIRGLFGDVVADAVSVLTHDKSIPYLDYIVGIKKNDLAVKVKIADLSHNMDMSRLPEITEKDWKNHEKYKEAFRILSE